MSSELDPTVARALRAARPAPPADFTARVMARTAAEAATRAASAASRAPAAVPARRPSRLAAAALVLAAAAGLAWAALRPVPPAPASGWALAATGPTDAPRWLTPGAPLGAGPDGATLVLGGHAAVRLEPGATVVADGDALHLHRGRAWLEGRARVITARAEVAGASDQTLASVEVDPPLDPPIDSALQESPMLIGKTALFAAALAGSAVTITVVRGQAELRRAPLPVTALAAGESVRLDGAAPTAAAPVHIDVGLRTPAGPAEAVPVVGKPAAPPAAAASDDEAAECAPQPAEGGECEGAGDCAECDGVAAEDPPADQRVTLAEDGAPAIGPTTARVTIIEFGDYQCSFCARAMSAVHELREIFPRDVRIVFMNFPLPGHKHARLAARAALAAGEQGKYWEMHDVLYAHQDALDRASLLGYARELGLDLERFTAALDDPRLDARLAADWAKAEQAGVRGTPTFLINGRVVVGARPIDELKAIVEEELKR